MKQGDKVHSFNAFLLLGAPSSAPCYCVAATFTFRSGKSEDRKYTLYVRVGSEHETPLAVLVDKEEFYMDLMSLGS